MLVLVVVLDAAGTTEYEHEDDRIRRCSHGWRSNTTDERSGSRAEAQRRRSSLKPLNVEDIRIGLAFNVFNDLNDILISILSSLSLHPLSCHFVYFVGRKTLRNFPQKTLSNSRSSLYSCGKPKCFRLHNLKEESDEEDAGGCSSGQLGHLR
ncbi:MAG: hypothetical protein JXB04_06920 [Kiritimatiellae bacterium]|nr:hypothetical protein [Kiritimatiellia bacterium]